MMFTIIAAEYEHIKRRAKEKPGNLPGDDGKKSVDAGVGKFIFDNILICIGIAFDA